MSEKLDTLIKKASELLKMSEENVRENYREIEEDLYYFYNPIRGGLAIIMNKDGSYLGASSSVNFDKHLEKFKNGFRNNNDTRNSMITNPKNLNLKELLNLRKEKIKLCQDKIKGINLDNNEMNNSGFLFFNVKLIIENIGLIDSKMINNFSQELSEEQKNKINMEISNIDSHKSSYVDISDVERILDEIINTCL